MTKTLTEQWREGTLPVGNYYINLVGDIERVDFFEGLKWERTKDFGIEEVLAPVPSYNEVKRLQEQLKEANEVIIYANNLADAYDEIEKYIKKWGVK